MRKGLWLVTCVLVIPGVWANAESLDLQIYTTGGAVATTVPPGTVVPVYIDAELNDETTDGLALISVNVIGGGAVLADTLTLDPPATGDMDTFVKNEGLTNPAGYGGTAKGDNLIQVGGGQNTIANDVGHAPYPIGTVSLNVGNSSHSSGSPIVIAEGSFDTTGLPDGVYTLTLADAFANTIDSGQAGPVYDVTPIAGSDFFYLKQTVTITVESAGPPPSFTKIESMGYHGPPEDRDLAVDIDPAGTIPTLDVIEPRMFTVSGKPDLYVRVTFDKDIATPLITVTEQGGVVTLDVTTTVWDNVTTVGFIDPPSNANCYVFDMTGTEASDGGVMDGTVDYDFCICYLEADVDRGGLVSGLDGAKLAASSNWGRPASQAADGPMADIDRSGIVTGLDAARVSAGANWNNSPVNSCP